MKAALTRNGANLASVFIVDIDTLKKNYDRKVDENNEDFCNMQLNMDSVASISSCCVNGTKCARVSVRERKCSVL